MSDLKKGDVVQIDPEHDEVFGGCFMIVTEPKSWGAQGYVPSLSDGFSVAYYRCKREHLAKVGKAEWMIEEDE